MEYPYQSLEQLIRQIEEPNQSACFRFLKENHGILSYARGSSNNHQAWEGGYINHIEEVMNMAIVLYHTLSTLRPLDFTLSDALLVLFLHDLEKPWKYEKHADGSWTTKPELQDKSVAVKEFVENKAHIYGFELSEAHKNGIYYAEGEKFGYSPKKRSSLPLAAFAHMCDHWSARGWFDYPKMNDPWKKSQSSNQS